MDKSKYIHCNPECDLIEFSYLKTGAVTSVVKKKVFKPELHIVYKKTMFNSGFFFKAKKKKESKIILGDHITNSRGNTNVI